MATTSGSGTRLGSETAVGLLIDGEGFARFRRQLETPWLARVWRRYLAHCEAKDSSPSAADLAFVAAVTGEASWQARAVEATLSAARLGPGAWVHPEAGCTTLTGMHRCYALCLAVDWLWPVLNVDQRQAVLGSIIAHSIENLTPMPDGIRNMDDGLGRLLMVRRLDIADPWCLHPLDAQVNNWDLWFACGVYMAAALAERAWLQPAAGEPPLAWGLTSDPGYALTPERIARWRGVACERMETGLANQVGPDGDYGEGANYAGYGGEALAACLTMRKRLEGRDFYDASVRAMPGWLRDQVVADPGFGVFNFNDARSEWRTATVLLAHITASSRDPQHMGLLLEAIEHQDAVPPVLALVALDADIPAAAVQVRRCSVYARTGQVIWRDSGGRSGRVLSMICGAHGGAHQHRDRGGFWLSAHGQRLLVDTGDSRYCQPPYPAFADTIAHNSLLIDGHGQIGDNTTPTNGTLVSTDHYETTSRLSATFDATACYAGIAGYTRALNIDPDRIRITDSVQTADDHVPTLTWLGQGYNVDGLGRWSVAGAVATYHRPGVELRITFHAPPVSVEIAAAPLEATPGGILRLAATFAGPQVIADMRIVPV